MSRIAAFQEHQWFPHRDEYKVWRHLVRAYEVDFTLIPRGGYFERWEDEEVVILDEQGVTTLEDFVHPENAVYVFGNTLQNDLIELPHDHSVVITYPGKICLFGLMAAAIVLEDRKRKWQ